MLEAVVSECEAAFTQLNSLLKDQNDRIADRLSQFLPGEPADEEGDAGEHEQTNPQEDGVSEETEEKHAVEEEPATSEITGLTFR